MDSRFGFTFPAIRGIQSGRAYYTSMCPLRIIPKIFLFDEAEAELSPELRAQRTLNRSRVPEMVEYINGNPETYTFSALTASIDADVEFESLGSSGESNQVGMLHVPMDAKFIINDGQHRRAAIEEALKQNTDLGDESIAVVFFVDRGLERCQQMFADLNRYAIRPAKSLGILYDHRDDMAQLARLVVFKSKVFKGIVEMERTSLSPRSRKLFTLSAIYSATKELLSGLSFDNQTEAARFAINYWEEISKHMLEWNLVQEGKLSSGEVRKDFIHSHGVTLQALGMMGNKLLKICPNDWQERLSLLDQIDWSRSNNAVWEGKTMVEGRISKSSKNIEKTANYLMKQIKLAV